MEYVGLWALDCCAEIMVWPDLFTISGTKHSEMPGLQHVRVFDLMNLPETERAVRMIIEVDDTSRARQLHPDLFWSVRYLVSPNGALIPTGVSLNPSPTP